MTYKAEQNIFPMPRSLVGRGIAALFCAPILSGALYYAMFFVRTALAAANALFIPQKHDAPARVSGGIPGFFEYSASGVVIFLLNYMTTVLAVGAAWLLGYIVLRYTKGGSAGARRYFGLSIFAPIAVFSIAAAIEFRAFPDISMDGALNIIFTFLCAPIYVFVAWFFFARSPLDSDALWENEYSQKEYIRLLYLWAGGLARKFGIRRLVIVALLMLAAEFARYEMMLAAVGA